MKVEFTPVSDYPRRWKRWSTRRSTWPGSAASPSCRPDALRRQDRAAGAARGRHQVPVGVHRQDRLGHQDPGRPEGQAGQLRLAKQHLGPPDAAQLPAAGRASTPRRTSKRVAYSGAHDATIAAVVSGKVEAGRWTSRCGASSWPRTRSTPRCRVFYTTPPYYNYNWSVHADMPAALRAKVQKALLALDPATPEGKEILELNRATRLHPDQARELQGHRSRRAQRRPALSAGADESNCRPAARHPAARAGAAPALRAAAEPAHRVRASRWR
jgi:hypothetical protein